MKKVCFISLVLLLSLIICSCNCKTQYGVYVKNDTPEQIKVSYKSGIDEQGIVEMTVDFAPGEYKRIIWTKDLKMSEDCSSTTPTHCTYVAEYVKAFVRDTIPSELDWCDEKIIFEKTDIGQAEFTIVYTMETFGL